MKFANIDGRLHLVDGQSVIDVAEASGGRLPSDPAAALQGWDAVLEWARSADTTSGTRLDESRLGPPSTAPSQMWAIGLNYAPHAAESGFQVPAHPFTFIKTVNALAGPFGTLQIDSDTVDWEVEMTVVIGKEASNVSSADAWSYVAGITAGQDFSDRAVQNRLGVNSQPTLGKSLVGFGPIGPYLVTVDEFENPDDIALSCTVNGEVMQQGRTSELIFDVPTLIEYLSAVAPLHPGDIIYTGTPAGVGFGRSPQVYLRDGDVVETWVDGVGTMRHVVAKRPMD